MEPKRAGFKSPILDFFPPLKEKDILEHPELIQFSLTGIELKGSRLYLISKEYPYSGKIKDHRAIFPFRAISSIYENEMGGFSFKFSKNITYFGNGGTGVLLEVPNIDYPYGFPYDMVARIKDKKEVIWENRDLEKILKLI